MLATAALFGLLSFWQTPEVACVAQGGEFRYPALARSARIQGMVVVHVVVGEDGVIAFADYEGHPMLAFPVAESIMSVRFPPECASKEVDLKIQYRLHEPTCGFSESIESAIGRSEWMVEAAPTLICDPQVDLGPRQLPWWKRIFKRR